MRLYEPSEGHIFLNGKDISTYSKESLRKLIATVLQDPFLFSKSVLDNISIAMEEMDKEKVSEYARLAQVEGNILAFKEGYETPIGDKGVTLSGGQRQRLALARALAAERPILLLDDSLSAVDSQTDLEIRKGLAKKRNTGLTLLITHRINTAKDADKILLLKDGSIEAIGKHSELLRSSTLYRQIASIQGVNLPQGKEVE